MTLTAPPAPVAAELGRFAAALAPADIPPSVRAGARLTMLDAVGVALAASGETYVQRLVDSLDRLGSPRRHPVIGRSETLSARDAALVNGALIHGLDYDDTHAASIVHASASALPVALAATAEAGGSGPDLVLGYVLAAEVSCRLGMVAGSRFHRAGFHPSGLVAAFGCAVAAGRIAGLGAGAIAEAQGIAASFASGTMAFLDDGTWTKRLQPGWAASAGLVAASLARGGFPAPRDVYEGRYGLYATHLRDGEGEVDPKSVVEGLGDRWEAAHLEVKPYPACVFIHPFIDAALELRDGDLAASDIATVDVDLPADAVAVVAEPRDRKLRPETAYQAQFSLPFAVAASLVYGRFGLAELAPAVLRDRRVLDLAARIRVRPDPGATMTAPPPARVEVTLRDGRTVWAANEVSRGPVRPAVEGKFLENAELGGHPDPARLCEAVLDVERPGGLDRLLKALVAR